MGWPLPLSAGAPLPEQSRRRARHVAASCLQPPRPSKLVVASRPCSESKECLFAAPPWFTRAGEVGQLNQADSQSLRSLRKQLRIKSKQSQFLLAANKRHVLLCFEAAFKPMPATFSKISHESASMVSKSSKIDVSKTERAWKRAIEDPQKAASFFKKDLSTQSFKGQKWPKIPECRRARARCSNPNFEAEGETPSWRDFQNCAALQDSAAKTARVSCQARPLPHCPAYAHRGVLWQPCKHQNMKQSKRLQLATENAVVAAGCDY